MGVAPKWRWSTSASIHDAPSPSPRQSSPAARVAPVASSAGTAGHISWYNRTIDPQTIEREALSLTPANRARRAHELLESLDTLSPEEIDELWLDEAERRLKELDAGHVQLVPAEEVYRKAQALLK